MSGLRLWSLWILDCLVIETYQINLKQNQIQVETHQINKLRFQFSTSQHVLKLDHVVRICDKSGVTSHEVAALYSIETSIDPLLTDNKTSISISMGTNHWSGPFFGSWKTPFLTIPKLHTFNLQCHHRALQGPHQSTQPKILVRKLLGKLWGRLHPFPCHRTTKHHFPTFPYHLTTKSTVPMTGWPRKPPFVKPMIWISLSRGKDLETMFPDSAGLISMWWTPFPLFFSFLKASICFWLGYRKRSERRHPLLAWAVVRIEHEVV